MEQHSPTTEHRLFNQRFALRRQLAKTALADVYLAGDMNNTGHRSQESEIFLLLVNTALAQQDGFLRAWQHALSRPAPPSPAYPEIIGFGEEQGQYWLALNNQGGELISEQIAALDERGQPPERALNTLHDISHALSGVQAGPFGHLEPGAIQQTAKGYVILNVPLVRVLQQLPDAGRASNKYALHSAYISPSVAVGDVPVTEDDTFSAAALLYGLLAGESPFGDQSSLSAVTHDYRPAAIRKLHKKTWDELDRAMAFQRKPRAENPDKLITALRKSNKRKMLLPATALAALGLMAFAVYHFVSKVGDVISIPSAVPQQTVVPQPAAIPESAQTTPEPVAQPQANTPDTTQATNQSSATTEAASEPAAETIAEPAVATEYAPESGKVAEASTAAETTTEPETETKTKTTTIERVNEPEIAAADEPAETEKEPATAQNTDTADNTIEEATTTVNTTEEATTTDAAAEQARQLAKLLQQAETAIDNNQLQDNSNQSGALTLLHRINELDEESAAAKTLLQQLLTDTFADIEQLIGDKNFEQAQKQLRESDKIIREFMVSGQLQRQVRLESQLAVSQQEQQQVEVLLGKAQAAIRAGNLSEDDSADGYALLHLDNLMFRQPDNTEGLYLLREVVRLRQQAARSALENGEIGQAGTYLSESERLIRKYQFTGLSNNQQELDTAYTDAMQGTATAAVSSSPATEVIESLPVERPAVNPISIQEVIPAVVEPAPPAAGQEIVEIIDPGTVIEDTTTESTPELGSVAVVPIWESSTLEPVQNQPMPDTAVLRPAPPVQTTRPANQPVQPRPGVFTYQPDNQLVEPVNPQVINQFTNTARPLEADPAALILPEINPGFRPQPAQYQPQQPQQPVPRAIQQPQQPRPVIRQPQPLQVQRPQQPQTANIPETAPLETIPELEEIPLSDLEDILPAAN